MSVHLDLRATTVKEVSGAIKDIYVFLLTSNISPIFDITVAALTLWQSCVLKVFPSATPQLPK